ncbi:hypothetical protein AK812_SmicGene20421 [Symbiodinium microadriaticum]|uniref:Uncharacterized protein n=1 Tax=Symbiodinium microadriaticum TaxID=2951 RepID=A0A1Q9DQ22_SYMMI|nr:hypothetical protein AK812_SmicGene20421 [Symbiodinium microadriaticum]
MSTRTLRIQADMQRAMLVHEHNKKKALEPRVTEPIILPEKPEKKIEPTPQRVTSPAPEPKAEPQAEGQAEQQAPQTATQLNSTAAAIASYGFTYDMSALYAAYGLGMPTVNAMSAVNMMPGYSFPATADVTTAMAQSQGAVAATGVADTVASEAPGPEPASREETLGAAMAKSGMAVGPKRPGPVTPAGAGAAAAAAVATAVTVAPKVVPARHPAKAKSITPGPGLAVPAATVMPEVVPAAALNPAPATVPPKSAAVAVSATLPAVVPGADLLSKSKSAAAAPSAVEAQQLADMSQPVFPKHPQYSPPPKAAPTPAPAQHEPAVAQHHMAFKSGPPTAAYQETQSFQKAAPQQPTFQDNLAQQAQAQAKAAPQVHEQAYQQAHAQPPGQQQPYPQMHASEHYQQADSNTYQQAYQQGDSQAYQQHAHQQTQAAQQASSTQPSFPQLYANAYQAQQEKASSEEDHQMQMQKFLTSRGITPWFLVGNGGMAAMKADSDAPWKRQRTLS